ncbi:hypothetical protein HED60_15175 [Planctomycetales bacterium ZRK34]|nr:hypothetical protein HED60_15175 [Planctomycetales bacterium ZRK34]
MDDKAKAELMDTIVVAIAECRDAGDPTSIAKAVVTKIDARGKLNVTLKGHRKMFRRIDLSRGF